MKKFILASLLILSLLLPAICAAANDKPHRLITAVDLLQLKGLAPFTPSCIIGTSPSGLVTAEDLLREKGLLGGPNNGNNSGPEEEDIWGMGQDFGC